MKLPSKFFWDRPFLYLHVQAKRGGTPPYLKSVIVICDSYYGKYSKKFYPVSLFRQKGFASIYRHIYFAGQLYHPYRDSWEPFVITKVFARLKISLVGAIVIGRSIILSFVYCCLLLLYFILD